MRRDFSLPAKKNWIYPLAIAANWLTMLGAAAAASAVGHPLAAALAIVIIGARQHALFIMVHEATHMHISSNRRVNDWISDLFCAFPLLFDTGVYRKNHLAHHRHLNSTQDPDWMRKLGKPGWTFPKPGLRLAWQIPFYVLFWGPVEILLVFWGFSGFGQKARWQAEPLFLLAKLAYFAAAAAAIVKLDLAERALMYWVVPMLFVLPFVTRVRNLAEHWAVNYSDDLNSTREVTPSWIEGFLLTPHHVNLHLTHHLYPHIPFYQLPQAHRQLVEKGRYEGAQLNTSYFLPYRNSVLRDVIRGAKAAEVLPESSQAKAA